MLFRMPPFSGRGVRSGHSSCQVCLSPGHLHVIFAGSNMPADMPIYGRPNRLVSRATGDIEKVHHEGQWQLSSLRHWPIVVVDVTGSFLEQTCTVTACIKRGIPRTCRARTLVSLDMDDCHFGKVSKQEQGYGCIGERMRCGLCCAGFGWCKRRSLS